MSITDLLQKAEKFEIQTYKKPSNIKDLIKTHVPFSGSLLRHPYDSGKVILMTDPYSTNTFYYEFQTDDISYLEKLPNLVNLEGETVSTARIWVKKMSLGVLCTPFIVEDTRAK